MWKMRRVLAGELDQGWGANPRHRGASNPVITRITLHLTRETPTADKIYTALHELTEMLGGIRTGDNTLIKLRITSLVLGMLGLMMM